MERCGSRFKNYRLRTRRDSWFTGTKVGRPWTSHVWAQVAAWVGEWPLALELLNASLRVGAVSPRELLRKTGAGSPATELERHMAALRGTVPEGTLRGVTEALGVPYQRLTEDLRVAVRRLARLGPNAIPVALVASWEPSVRVQMKVRSFVCDVHSGDVEMFGRMHRVLADFLRGQGDEWEPEVQAVCEMLLAVMEWSACADPKSWPLLNACRPHAEALIDREAAQATSVELVERLVDLHRMIGRLLHRQGHNAVGEGWLLRGLDLARRRLDERHPTTLRTLGQLAWMLRRRDALGEARALQESVLKASRESLGEEHTITLQAMRNLALTLADLGELEPARRLQDRVWRTLSDQYGLDHAETLTAISDLARTLRRRGEMDRALELEATMPDAWWQWLEPADVNTLTAQRNLARTMREQGDLARAHELQERVLAARQRLEGEDHPDTLGAMAELATTLCDRGEVDRARELRQRVLDGMRRVLGNVHPDTLRAVAELAALPA